jgi:hypothetical protein
VEVLAQSQASVRGTRVQKLRCDEVDLFDPEVWEAAQLTTRSARCGGVDVRGSVECLSTMHVPFGVMHRLVEEARGGARALFRWGVADVLAACGPEHACGAGEGGASPIALPRLATRGPCPLWEECRGRAKREGREPGHVEVRDALIAKARVSRAVWESEMLCRIPRRGDAVLPEFDPARHVLDDDATPGGAWVAGMDFGIRSPAVVLLACVEPGGVVRVLEERVEAGQVLDAHVQAIREGLARDGRPAWPQPLWIGIDPAGLARNEQTGVSAAGVLRRAGYRVRAARLPVLRGVALLRAMLAPASGPPTLFVHRRCRRLIESMARYRYPPDRPECPEPVKGEGWDHAVDALRYLVQNLTREEARGACYL